MPSIQDILPLILLKLWSRNDESIQAANKRHNELQYAPLSLSRLEDRRVLNATVFLDAAGVLHILDDGQGNLDNTVNVVSLNGGTEVRIFDGDTLDETFHIADDGIASISIDLGAGNDTLHLQVVGLPTTVVDGEGNDVVYLTDNRDILTTTDTIQVQADQIYFGETSFTADGLTLELSGTLSITMDQSVDLGEGTFELDGSLSGTGDFSLTADQMTLVLDQAALNGSLTLTADQISLEGDLSANHLSMSGDVTLTGDTTLDASGGEISFSNSTLGVDGSGYDFTLTATNLNLAGISDVGVLSVSGTNISLQDDLSAESLTITGDVSLDGDDVQLTTLTGDLNLLNAAITSGMGNGHLTLVSGNDAVLGSISGIEELDVEASSAIILNQNISTNQSQYYRSHVELANDVVLAFGLGAAIAPQLIFEESVSGNHQLTINSPDGDVTFRENVGAATDSLRGIHVETQGDVLFEEEVFVGSGGLSIVNASEATFEDDVTITNAGNFSIQQSNGATLTLAQGTDWTLDGGNFTQTGEGSVEVGANISALGGEITFGADSEVTITDDVEISLTSGDLTFGGELDLDGDLLITSGGASISFQQVDGDSLLTINANNAAVVFNGEVGSVNGLEGIALDVGTAEFLQEVNVGSAGFVVEAQSTVLHDSLTSVDDIIVSGYFKSLVSITSSLGDIRIDGESNIQGEINSESGDVHFLGHAFLTDSTEINAGRHIYFWQQLDSYGNTPADLTLSAVNNIEFLHGAGRQSALGQITVKTANDLSFNSSVMATKGFTQLAGTGDTRFRSAEASQIGGALHVNANSISFIAGTMVVDDGIYLNATEDLLFFQGASLDAGKSTIEFHVNSDGIGTGRFNQQTNSVIQTANESAKAVQIFVGGDGDATISQIITGSSTGHIIMNVGGEITGLSNTGSAPHIQTFHAILVAGEGIGSSASGGDFRTQIHHLTFDAGQGGVYLNNTGALDIVAADGITSSTIHGGRLTTNSPLTISMNLNIVGDYDFIAGNSAADNDHLTINANITGDGTGVLRFVAGDHIFHLSGIIQNDGNEIHLTADAEGDAFADGVRGGIVQNSGGIIADRLAIRSYGDVTLIENIQIDTLAANLTGAGSQLAVYNNLGLTIGTVDSLSGISTNAGDVILGARGEFVLGTGAGEQITAPGGIVNINVSSGGLTTAAGSSITASGLTVHGLGNFLLTGQNTVETFSAQVGGSLDFHNTQALTIGSVAGIHGVTAASGGSINVVAEGELTVNSDVTTTLGSGGTISLDNLTLNASVRAGAGNINLQGGGQDLVINVDQTWTSNAELTATRNAVLNADINITSAVSVDAGNDVTLTANGTIDSQTGPIDIEAGGALNMNAAARILAGTGTVTLTADQNVTLGNVETSNSTAQAIQITSHQGAILDAGVVGSNLVANASGAVVTLSAATGMGTTAAPLKTQVDSLRATNSASGAIQIREADSVRILEMNQNGSDQIVLETTNGSIQLVANEGGISTQSGDVILRAGGAASDILLQDDIESLGGDVQLTSGRSIQADSNVAITTTAGSGVHSGNVTLTAQGSGTVDYQGAISTQGADSANGGDVLITTQDGAITLGAINVSGGNSTTTGGSSGNLTVIAGDANSSNDSHITLTGSLSALGGSGATSGAHGAVSLTAGGDVIDGNDGQTLISTGDLSIQAANNIGEITDFENRTGNAIDAVIHGELTNLSTTQGGGSLHLNVIGDLKAATGSIVPGGANASTLLIQTTGNLDVGSAVGAMSLSDGDRVGLHSDQTLILPDAGLNVGAGDLMLSGTQDVIDPSGRDLGKLVANSLTFHSGSVGGSTTLNTQVNQIRADLSSAPSTSDLIINEDDSLIVQNIVTAGGDVRVQNALAAAGDLTIHHINAGDGNVLLDTTANGGQILDGDDLQPDIIANGLGIRATDGIANNNGLEVQVSTLAATTQQGDIQIHNQSDLTIGDVEGVSGLTIANGNAGDDVVVSANGTLSIQENVSVNGGNITLAADDVEGQILLADGVLVEAVSATGNAQLIAGNNIVMGQNSEVQTQQGDIELLAGVLFNQGTGLTNGNSEASILMDGQSRIASDSGDITLRALRDVEVSRIDANRDGNGTAGNVVITADDNGLAGAPRDGVGEIRDVLPSEDANIRANQLTLQAASGIGSSDQLQIDVTSVAATNTHAGNIQLEQVAAGGDNALTVNGASNAGGNIDIRTQDGDLVIADAIGTVGAGQVSLVAGDADLDGNGNLQIQAAVTTDQGDIQLVSEGNHVSLTDAGDVTTTAGNVTVEAGGTDGAGEIQQAEGSVIHAGSGQIAFDAHGTVTLGQLITSNTSTDAVSITTTGRIESANTGNPALINITAPGGRLIIDSGEGVNPIRTTVGSLDLVNHTSGNVTIIETDGLDVVRLHQDATSGARNVDLTTGGTMRILGTGSGVSATTGNVTLLSQGVNSDIHVESTVQATTGNVKLVADRDLFMNNDGQIVTETGSITVMGGGDPVPLPPPGTGGVFMEDGAEIFSQSGDIKVWGETGITVSHISTTTSVILATLTGSIDDGGDSAGVNIKANQLALYSDKGIGSGNALEINVAELAAYNDTSGNIQLNNISGTLLTVTQIVDPQWGTFDGMNNMGSGGGTIELTNQGGITVNSGLLNQSGGQVAITAHDNGGDDDHLTISAPIIALGPDGDIFLTAGTDLILNDTPLAEDIVGNSITGIAARDVVYEDGLVVRSSTGSVTSPTPYLGNVTAPQLTTEGLASINGDFGRAGDNNFRFVITWDTNGPVQDGYDSGDPVYHHSDGTTTIAPSAGPGTFEFDHIYLSHPDPDNPADDIPITITVYDDHNITFIADGKDLGVASETVYADVPGSGLATAAVFDLSIEVPAIETPRVQSGDAAIVMQNSVLESNQAGKYESIVEVEVHNDDRVVIVEKIGKDGQIETDVNGRLLQIFLYGEEAQWALEDQVELYERLQDGHWRIYLQEGGDAQPQLVRDIVLQNGKLAGDDAGTLDRPPTESENPLPSADSSEVEQQPSELEEFKPVSSAQPAASSEETSVPVNAKPLLMPLPRTIETEITELPINSSAQTPEAADQSILPSSDGAFVLWGLGGVMWGRRIKNLGHFVRSMFGVAR